MRRRKGSADLGDGDVPEIISMQLNHWYAFRQRWQWDNRGKAPGKAGFPAYLEWQRRSFLHEGADRAVSDNEFEDTSKGLWDLVQTFVEESGRTGFAAYVEAVSNRLATHRFTQPFRLFEDPCQQDERTT